MAAPGNRLGQVARVVILVGLALLALGNAVEAIGIWGWSWNGSGRYVAPNQSLVQTHELGRLGSTLRELLVVAGVLLSSPMWHTGEVVPLVVTAAGLPPRRSTQHLAPLRALLLRPRRSGRPLGDLLTPSLSNTLVSVNGGVGSASADAYLSN
jgi:hypothetical protein